VTCGTASVARHPESRRIDVGGIEPRSHTFVIRIWLERAGEEKAWRGHITDVVTGQRDHFAGLTAILDFVQSRLHRDTPAADDPGRTCN
jgi:hypothetical protein